MAHDGTLGVDYVTLKGRGGRDTQNGATIAADGKMHLSVDIGRTTVCGHGVENFLLTYSDVDIDCPNCIAELKSRRIRE